MIVELWDMDVEYRVSTDTNAHGKDFVRINVGSSEEEYDLCLNSQPFKRQEEGFSGLLTSTSIGTDTDTGNDQIIE